MAIKLYAWTYVIYGMSLPARTLDTLKNNVEIQLICIGRLQSVGYKEKGDKTIRDVVIPFCCIIVCNCTYRFCIISLSPLKSSSWCVYCRLVICLTLHITELRCTLWSYSAPSWATLHLSELRCTLLSYATSTLVIYAASYWATMHPAKICCTILSYAAS